MLPGQNELADIDDLLTRLKQTRPPAVRTLGDGEVIAWELEDDRITMRWRATVDHCHSVEGHPKGGIVQGGFVTGWLDSAMAHACLVKSGFTIGVPSLEIKVSFLRPAHPGAYRSIGWITRWGRRIAFMEAELRDEADELIARGSSTAALTRAPGGTDPVSQAG